MYKFEKFAQILRALIEQGTWQPNERLPSLRDQAQNSGYSLMTVMSAYQELEAQGLIYSLEKSGYYIAVQPSNQHLESQAKLSVKSHVKINSFVFNYLKATQHKNFIRFGSAFPDEALLYQPKLMQILSQHAKRKESYLSLDSMPPGHFPLQQIIARRYSLQGLSTNAEDIVITSGCLEALNLSLQAVTKNGDYILLQETIFYGAWQAAERLGLKVITLPEHPIHGFDLDLFEQCLQQYPIKVCWFMLNIHNPIGFTVSNDIKQKIAQLLAQYRVHLIEDDVYQELYYGTNRPLSVKYFDQEGWVLHCSSFSKTLGTGFRVGWVHAKAHSPAIQHLQLMSTLTVNPLLQHALVDYLSTHHYEKHLKQLRLNLERNKRKYYVYLKQSLPQDCEVYYFDHGYFLWVKLPLAVGSMQIYETLLTHKISLAPSALFDIDQQNGHFVRLNCSFAWSDTIEQALGTVVSAIQQSDLCA